MTKVTKSLKSAQKGRFVGIPHIVASTEVFRALRAPEVKLLFDLQYQFNGRNNGYLSPCHTLMRERGWAKAPLYRSYSRLEHLGFIVVTRQGWKQRGKPTLVAITWNPIDDPPEHVTYDEGIFVTGVALNYWAKASSSWQIKPRTKVQKLNSNKKDKDKPSYSTLILVASK